MAVAAEHITGIQHTSYELRVARMMHCYRCLDAPLRARLARETRCVADAEDLAQEAFLRLWRVREWDEIHSPEAFVLKAAANLVKDRSRRTYRRMQLSAVPISEFVATDFGNEPHLVAEALETLSLLVQAIARLSAATQEAFALYRLENCTHAQIAERLGISVSMVEKHVSRAMRALRGAGVGNITDRR
jgi:RNA polymerase sigma factor (sigma-70 family)